ncbi:BTAD domain-containing putative transcriptional regulator [Kribbella italica]|uniref:DNA-binding SARP family transcriptional activator n=1 Tax=Kribbella italica TaxID=1540520 RepID=A0A7W9JCP1_9ACTN|nr:DNA-binding SARP family transcriptional activator [Kribbella italica]
MTAPGQRALLAALAVRTGWVDATDLTGQLWDRRPSNPRAALQNAVLRLRRALGVEQVQSGPAGYQLVAEVDVRRFEELCAQDAVDAALALWRGEPLVDCGSEVLRRTFVPTLTERYLGAVERRADPLPDELQELAGRHPLRESLWARLIVVLEQLGRRDEALNAYEAVRAHLAEELGADPSEELREAYRRLSELPVGDDGLSAVRRGSGLAVVYGEGKTALVRQWAREQSFPDGEIRLDLQGSAAGCSDLLRAVGVTEIPERLEEQSALFRTVTAGRRMLVLLDNARDAEQVRPLLPGRGPMVVVTSRAPIQGLQVREGAVAIRAGG